MIHRISVSHTMSYAEIFATNSEPILRVCAGLNHQIMFKQKKHIFLSL